jgi:hypothetical protein
MKLTTRLLFGPASAALFVAGIVGLALLVPDYSQVRQTVSEIGELGSPARMPFAIMLCCVAACNLVFAAAVREFAIGARLSQLPAFLIGFVSLTSVGLAICAFPHPLHNVFGLSATIGYQAPAALAIAWRKDAKSRKLVTASWVCFVVFWTAGALNLAPLYSPHLAGLLRPYNGIAQRTVFGAWFGWCVITGLSLWLRERRKPQ